MPVKQPDLLLVFGLKSCDSCSKALAWLREHGVIHEFRDLRKEGIDPERLKRWLASPSSLLLTNRRSTTWRNLTVAEKALSDTDPVKLLSTFPALIKRPVLERQGQVLLIGFSPDVYRQHLLS